MKFSHESRNQAELDGWVVVVLKLVAATGAGNADYGPIRGPG